VRGRHRGIKASSRRKAEEERQKSHPQITQIERRLFKRILRGRERQEENLHGFTGWTGYG